MVDLRDSVNRVAMSPTGIEADGVVSLDQPDLQSVLAGAGACDIAAEPFYHLIAPNALPAQRYRDLAASFPSSETILHGRASGEGNTAARLPAFKVLDNPSIAPVWRDFFALHTSQRFCDPHWIASATRRSNLFHWIRFGRR